MPERTDRQRRHTAASLENAYMLDEPVPEGTVRDATPDQVGRWLLKHGRSPGIYIRSTRREREEKYRRGSE